MCDSISSSDCRTIPKSTQNNSRHDFRFKKSKLQRTVFRNKHPCTHVFLTATFKDLHIENSKNYKRWYCPHHTDWVSMCCWIIPKTHILARDRVVWAIACKNPPKGLTCRWVSEKKAYGQLQKFLHIFHLFAEKPPPVQIYMKFCMRGHLTNVINCAKFYLNWIRGFDSVGDRIFGFPIRKRSRH